MNKLKIGLLYVSLHNIFKRNAGVTRELNKKQFFCIMGKHFLIPKSLRMLVIKELEQMGLVEDKGNGYIIILDYDIDLKRDAEKLYKMCGIY